MHIYDILKRKFSCFDKMSIEAGLNIELPALK